MVMCSFNECHLRITEWGIIIYNQFLVDDYISLKGANIYHSNFKEIQFFGIVFYHTCIANFQTKQTGIRNIWVENMIVSSFGHDLWSYKVQFL